ncbi:MAG: HD domain-containing protein [Myxococcales bacterium]|nr:HD domain-containing protein [Myxococcales bacterium]MCB9531932.1 HD domain-containing protein [Myxococcales bacterium]MCB9533900.1 HD domain-containing protein [Myxococcales bacterium]
MAREVPELRGGGGSVRVPELRNVPLTRRIVEIVDHPAFQRLRSVRQLGPTHLVYPGAVHTRFEHSLGVFDMARQYLLALLRDPNVAESLTEEDLLSCLLAGLLHDLGHYPFAHSLEALHHSGFDTPRHEDLSGRILLGGVPALRGERPIGDIIREQFGIDPQCVVDLVTRKPQAHTRVERRLVATVISSGVDADKADYLERDSIHMGVSYGRNYDRARFLDSLCASVDGDAIAITDKGRVAAEIFIFCRYTMFSEAYWHHTVRAVSAMVERALADFQAREQMPTDVLAAELLSRPDDALLTWLAERSPPDSETARLIGAMTGGRRRFYKRVLALNRVFDDIRHHNAYERVYHLDKRGLRELEAEIAATLSKLCGSRIDTASVIIDTPPRDKDRIETVQVVYDEAGKRSGRRLDEVSKVVQGIGTDFMKVVKKIRIFVAPEVRAQLDAIGGREAVVGPLFKTILDFVPERDMQQSLL